MEIFPWRRHSSAKFTFLEFRLETYQLTCVYALLQYKTRAAYIELLQAIVDRCEDIGLDMMVQTVVTDFE